MPLVDILLATYNGARFLPDLLESLQKQSIDGWRLIVRDDGSGDGTPELVERWAGETGACCIFLRDGDRGLGASGNFARLLSASDAPYFMFCDQDDVWMPDKVALALETVSLAERDCGSDTPLLAHCDLTVVDETLEPVAPSFWAHQEFAYTEATAGLQDVKARRSLLVRNFVTGCTMIGNAALRARAHPIPAGCVMHDWWMALVAAHLGEIRAIEQPGILYRQHTSNTLGARRWTFSAVAARGLSRPGAVIQRTRAWLVAARLQAQELHERFAGELSADDVACLVEFSRGRQVGLIARKTFMFRHGVWPHPPARSLITFMIV
jgi:hypothetical protein